MQRLTRAMLLAALSTGVAALAHGLAATGGGRHHGITIGGVALAFLLSAMGASVLAPLRHRPAGLALILGLGQAAYHAIFTLTAATHTAATRTSTAAFPGHSAHGTTAIPLPAGSASLADPGMVLLHAAAWMASVAVALGALTALERAARSLAVSAQGFALAAAACAAGTVRGTFERLQELLEQAGLHTVRTARQAWGPEAGVAVVPWSLRGPPRV